MATAFGSQTDHFGLTATGAALVGATVVSASSTPRAETSAEARDALGDVASMTWYGNDGGSLSEASVTYAWTSGSLSVSGLSLGELATGIVVTSIEVSTSNSEWPQITVAGVLGSDAITAVTGYENLYGMPSATVLGLKMAQGMGATAGAAGRLTGATLTASCDLAEQADGDGEPVAFGLAGAVATLSVEMVGVTGSPSVTWATGWTETQAESLDQPQAAYHTSTANAERYLTRTEAA